MSLSRLCEACQIEPVPSDGSQVFATMQQDNITAQRSRTDVADPLDPEAVPFSPRSFALLGITPPPSPATLHRWRLRGLHGVRIVTFLRGGRRFVTRGAISQFYASVTRAADSSTSAPYDKSAAHVFESSGDQADLADVDRELEQEGL